MAHADEPRDDAAEVRQTGTGDTVALVDLFDQLDRAAFEKTLTKRDLDDPSAAAEAS